jgi:hypothetical protein
MTTREEPPPGYRTQSPDVDYWTEQAQFERWRRMEPHEKCALISEMCRAEAEAQIAELRRQHPKADEEELDLRLAALRYGSEFVKKFTGIDVNAL